MYDLLQIAKQKNVDEKSIAAAFNDDDNAKHALVLLILDEELACAAVERRTLFHQELQARNSWDLCKQAEEMQISNDRIKAAFNSTDRKEQLIQLILTHNCLSSRPSFSNYIHGVQWSL